MGRGFSFGRIPPVSGEWGSPRAGHAERSVAMTKKKTASTTKKKTAPKGAARTRAAKKSSPASIAPPVRSGGPLPVLAIMALLAVIALMVNHLYLAKGSRRAPVHVGKETSGDAQRVVEPEGREPVKKEKPEVKPGPGETRPITGPVIEEVKVYFVRHDARDDGLRLVPVSRKVDTKNLLEQTLRELARGPTASEKGRGLLTAVPPDLRVRSVKVRNRIAEVDFNGAIEEGAAGSILINRVDQIVYTLTEFPGVDGVLIKVNGTRRNTLGADGLSIGAPRDRSR